MPAHNLVDKRGSNNVWITPQHYIEPVRRYSPIGLDPCTEESNPAGAEHYYTEDDDGLVQGWSGYGLVYVNPPYSTFVELDPDDFATKREYEESLRLAKREYLSELKDIGEELFGAPRAEVSSLIVLWALKINEQVRQGVPLIALLPCGARFSTRYWQKNILSCELDAACFVEGRVPFIDGRTGEPVNGNTYDSIYYGYNVDADLFDACFNSMGATFAMKRKRVNPLDGYI